MYIEDDNKQLCYWFVYSLYYTFIIMKNTFFLPIKKKKKLAAEQGAILCPKRPYTSRLIMSLPSIASFALVLDLISCCFVPWHAMQASSLGAVGYLGPMRAVGYNHRGLWKCTL